MNPIQKYPHIIELSACIVNMFVLMFVLNMFNTKTVKVNNFTYKAIQCVPTSKTVHTCELVSNIL